MRCHPSLLLTSQTTAGWLLPHLAPEIAPVGALNAFVPGSSGHCPEPPSCGLSVAAISDPPPLPPRLPQSLPQTSHHTCCTLEILFQTVSRGAGLTQTCTLSADRTIRQQPFNTYVSKANGIKMHV